MILGVTGTNGAGKDTVGQYLLEKLGWELFSLSDELRTIARERGLGLDRMTLRKLGNELRAQHGADYVARRVLQRAGENCVVISIRTPAELIALKERGDFVLIFVDAPLATRYQRLVQGRHRAGEESLTLEQFVEQEEAEMQGGETEQQVAKVLELADVKIDNDGTIEELNAKLDQLIKEVVYGKAKLG